MIFLKYSVFVFVICSVASSRDLNKQEREFARKFYWQCTQAKSGNVIVSQLSVINSLALLSQGLHKDDQVKIEAEHYFEQRESLRKSAGDATISIANGIYIQQGKQINKYFQDVAISKFDSIIDSINFADSQKSAQIINDFVEEKTNGKIKNIVEPADLNTDTRAVLINAIYFRSIWEIPFKKQSTTKKDFFNTQTEKQSVDFMFVEGDFKFADLEALGATALEMKYANSNISFVIVLPNDRMGLETLETELKTLDWMRITEMMYPRKVAVHIPKFKVEYELKLNDVLNDVLKNMGLGDIFSANGGLNRILESGETLKVSKVIHKAFIEVNEEGTEAAAATGIEIMRPMAVMPPHHFTVDHPFMYFILRYWNKHHHFQWSHCNIMK